ncbi:nuclease domain-containing protein [Paraburkholderia tropica]|uniref:nuclease domain-containing protein n=1 Tax=Paraburkholderia tropica TaxID=92647 RepID=UPI0038B881E6
MKRTGFKRKEPKPFALTPRKSLERHAAIRRRVKKPTVAEGSKYLAACRNEPCYLRVPGVCRRNPNDETVVPCHENSLAAGKGMGLKSNHARTVPGCFWCHSWLDQGSAPREKKQVTFSQAYLEWSPVRARKMGITEEVECSQ